MAPIIPLCLIFCFLPSNECLIIWYPVTSVLIKSMETIWVRQDFILSTQHYFWSDITCKLLPTKGIKSYLSGNDAYITYWTYPYLSIYLLRITLIMYNSHSLTSNEMFMGIYSFITMRLWYILQKLLTTIVPLPWFVDRRNPLGLPKWPPRFENCETYKLM